MKQHFRPAGKCRVGVLSHDVLDDFQGGSKSLRANLSSPPPRPTVLRRPPSLSPVGRSFGAAGLRIRSAAAVYDGCRGREPLRRSVRSAVNASTDIHDHIAAAVFCWHGVGDRVFALSAKVNVSTVCSDGASPRRHAIERLSPPPIRTAIS